MLRKKLLIIALAVFGTLFSLPAAANTCPSASPQGVGCPAGTYYCYGSCRSGLSWCPTWSPTPICASGLDCSNCSSADSCGVCNACNSGYRLCGTYPNSFCKANSTLPPNCASYNANCDSCATCLAGYTLSGSSCVTAILKLGPSSVSSTNVVLGGDDSSLFVSGNKVGIGNSGPTANLHLNATTDTEGLRIVTSNYSPFVIRNTADTEDLFRIDQEGNITGVGSFGSGDSYWALNDSNLYASSTSWNIGIGTTTPGRKFVIQANHSNTQFLMHSLGGGTAETEADLMLWASEPDATYTGVGIANNIYNTTAFPRINTVRGGSYMRLLENAIAFNTVTNTGVNTNTMYMNGGNVGIGNTNPGTYKLNVTGTTYFNGASTVNGILNVNSGLELSTGSNRSISYYGPVSNGYFTQMQTTATTGYGTYGPVTSDWALYNRFSGSNTRGWIWQLGTSNIAALNGQGNFQIAGNLNSQGASNNYFAGNVGIGNTAPSYKLDVSGTGRFTQPVIVGAPTVADHAATKSYVDSAVSTGAAATLSYEDNRTISPSELAANRMKFGFTSYTNNNAAPYADFLHFRSYQNASGGSDNLLVINKTGLGMRLYQQAYGTTTAYTTYKDIVLANNTPTVNYLTKYSSAGTNVSVVNSQVYDNGTNVGIGTTNPGAYKLNVTGSIYATGMTLGGDLNLGSNNITGVNKLTVNTIDPLYRIKGINYSTFASAIVGGVKEEYVGRIEINQPIGEAEYEKVIDFDKVEKGSDLWVWRQVVDFNPDNIQVFLTPYGDFANTYYDIIGNRLVFRADKPIEVSYRLIGKRFDWRQWPTKALDQSEKAGLIIH